jgi:TolB-like protein/Flp pilus assembly protein TadD
MTSVGPRPALATAGVAEQPTPRPADGSGTDTPLTIWNELKRRNVFRVGAAYAAIAWLIIEVATTVQDVVGLGDMAVRVIVTTLAIGLPIALALAWAFEVTPDGILYDKPDLVQNESLRARRLRRLDAVTILTITIATSVFVYRSLTFDSDDASAGGSASPPPAAAPPPPTLAAQSIAVMPFIDLTSGEDKGYFADGLAEELIALLGQSPSLRVVPRTASFYYKGKDVEMTTIAERLRVNHILEGSVRVGDERVRVLATLSDARSATLLWSESFEIAPAGIFDVQDTIASAVADALAIQLDIGTSETAFAAPTQNVGAYEFYLRGLDYLNRPKSLDNLSAAEALFQRALDLDPQYGRAYAGLCETHLGVYVLTSDVKSFEAAERACHRGLTLDRSQDDIYLALGQMYRHSGQYDKAIRELRSAVARHPNRGVGHMELGLALADAGELEQAERELLLGVELEPGYWGGYTALGYFLYRQGRYEEALAYYQVTVELTPDNPAGYTNLAAAYYMLGDFERAGEAYEASLALAPTRTVYTNTGLMYYYTGRFDLAVEMQQRAVELAPEDHRIWGRLAESARFVTGMEEQSQLAYQRAYELATVRLRINPRDADTIGHLALYAAHLGKHAETDALLVRGFDVARDDPDMHYFAALVAIEGGDIPRAYEHLVRSLELGFSATLIQADPDIAPLIEDGKLQALLAAQGKNADAM